MAEEKRYSVLAGDTWKPLDNSEYAAYVRWFKQTYSIPNSALQAGTRFWGYNVGEGSKTYPGYKGIRNLEPYQYWVEIGKPGYAAPADPNVATPKTPQTPTTTTPLATPDKKEDIITFTSMYGGRVLRGSDGKWYNPDDRTVEMSPDDVNFAYNEYLKQINQQNNPPSDPRLDWDKEKWNREIERQQAEGRNKAWSLQNESQRMQSESAIEKQRNEIELIKGRSFLFPYEQGNRAAYQDMQRTAFENARQSILGSLTAPADWVKKWEVEHAPNPYTPQPQSPLEQSQGEVDNTNTRVNMFNQMADEAEKLVATLSNDPAYAAGFNSPNEASILTQARADAANYRNAANAEMGKLPAYQADVTYLQGQPQPAPSQPVRPGNAPAPGWLPMFAPGQRAGQPITRENVATPSAQQWAATPWSVQQGLSGYLDWAGYRPMADVLGNMAQMLPNAPGGGARWSPLLGR